MNVFDQKKSICIQIHFNVFDPIPDRVTFHVEMSHYLKPKVPL